MLARLSGLSARSPASGASASDGPSDNEAGAADAAVQRLASEGLRRHELKKARQVKSLAARRRAVVPRDTDGPDGLQGAFGIYANSALQALTTGEVHRRIFQPWATSVSENKIDRRFENHMFRVTLYRYLCHQRDAFDRALATLPVQDDITIASVRFKWDETQQIIAVVPNFGQVPELARAPIKKAPRTVHVMTIAVWVRLGGSVDPWATLPVQLQRTTAECLWLGLQSAFPHGPWGHCCPSRQPATSGSCVVEMRPVPTSGCSRRPCGRPGRNALVHWLFTHPVTFTSFTGAASP